AGGALVLTQLVRWLFGPGEGGLFTGGVVSAVTLFAGAVLGAVGLVALFAFVATRPAYLRALQDLFAGHEPGAARSLRDGFAVFLARALTATMSPRVVPLSRADCRDRLRV